MGIKDHCDENEKIHRAMFNVHHQLAAAHSIAHNTATMIYSLGGHHGTRSEYKDILLALEAARDDLAALLYRTAESRTEFIRQSGCDSSCNQ